MEDKTKSFNYLRAFELESKYFSTLEESIARNMISSCSSLDLKYESMTVDKLIIYHAKFIKILCQKAREILEKSSTNITLEGQKAEAKTVLKFATHSFLNIEENWKGKGKKQTKFEPNNSTTFSIDMFDLDESNGEKIFLECFRLLSLL